MKRIITLSFAAIALLLAGSCQREGVIYDPAGSACVSFPAEDAIFEMVAEDGNKITVELWRGNTKGTTSIPVDIEDQTDGVFTPSKRTFDFADGEAVAKIDFTYPDINDFGGEVYSIVLTIADPEQVSPSGIDQLTVSAQRKLTRKFLGTGLFYSDFFGAEWEQDIFTTEEAPDLYILPDCWETGTDWTFTMENGEPVFPMDFFTGYVHSTYGNVYIRPSESYIEDGVLYLIVAHYFVSAGSFGDGYEAFVLPDGLNL